MRQYALGQYVLEPAQRGVGESTISDEDDDDDDDRSRSWHIEVVRQGQYVGLRSQVAGGRFLQPRRKAPHPLVFFRCA